MKLGVIAGGDGTPPEPDWAGLYVDEFDVLSAKEHWQTAINELKSRNVLATANGHAIERLVQFRVQFDRAAKHVAEHGPIRRAKRAKTGQWNPYWSVMQQADKAVRELEDKLGISPLKRAAAAKVDNARKAPRAADRYLKALES